jgi:chromosome segregation ATPase/transposase-like protein
MKELSREKRQEVVQHYILGCSYEEITGETGVSHGTVANIIREVDNGQLTIPGSTFDQVNDLRQLSLELKKKNIEPSQAQLGLLLFEKFRALGITPEMIDKWAELTKRFTPVDFPAEEFFGIALRLHELEKTEGKPFEVLTEEYKKKQEDMGKVSKDVDSLLKTKSQLSGEIGPLSKELESLKRAKEKLEDQTEIQDTKKQGLESEVKELREEKAQLNKQIKNLKRKEIEISAHVEGGEESLMRINEIGLADEDLLRLRTLLEKMSENEGIDCEQVKKRFFLTLSLFGEVSEIERYKETEAKRVKALTKEQSVLEGQITELEKTKSKLEGEIDSSASSISRKIHEIGMQASQQIEHQVIDIRKLLSDLFSDILKAGEAVGQMSEMVRKGEESQKSLKIFLEEAQSRSEAR